jgi:hypothetical protein
VERWRPTSIGTSAFGELDSSLKSEFEELSDGSDEGGSWFNLAAPQLALSKKRPTAIRLGVASLVIELDFLAAVLRRIESAMFCLRARFASLEGGLKMARFGKLDCLSRLSSFSSSAIRSASAWPGIVVPLFSGKGSETVRLTFGIFIVGFSPTFGT